MGLADEIREQPEAAARLLNDGRGAVAAVARALRARRPRFGVLAARGSSDHAGIYAQYLLGDLWRLPVALATPSVLTLYDSAPRYDDALVLGISQSGRSPDIVRVVEEGRRQGALTVAITNDAGSALAAAAEYVIDVRAGPERAIAATKSYTNQLLAVAMLAAELADDSALRADLERVPAWIEAALAEDTAARSAAESHAAMDRCVVLGRGYDLPTAREWALKLQELALVFAQAYSAADFEHGPIALADGRLAVLAVAATAAAAGQMAELTDRLLTLGCDLLAIAPRGAPPSSTVRTVAIPPGMPDRLAPLAAIVPAQLYTYHLTRAKGLDPDAPRGLRKVTLTT